FQLLLLGFPILCNRFRQKYLKYFAPVAPIASHNRQAQLLPASPDQTQSRELTQANRGVEGRLLLREGSGGTRRWELGSLTAGKSPRVCNSSQTVPLVGRPRTNSGWGGDGMFAHGWVEVGPG